MSALLWFFSGLSAGYFVFGKKKEEPPPQQTMTREQAEQAMQQMMDTMKTAVDMAKERGLAGNTHSWGQGGRRF